MAEAHLRIPVLTHQDVERFWSRVDRNGPTPAHRPELGPCWNWTAGTFVKPEHDGDDYGAFRLSGGNFRTHRVAYFIETGEDPGPMLVLHRCDNRKCCRPSHLFTGDQWDNVQDCRAKGRLNRPAGDRHRSRTCPELTLRGDNHPFRLHPELVRRGERHPQAIFTEDDVRQIRRDHAAGMSMYRIAKNRHVSEGCITHIVKRHTWKHVPD
jgi:hypothetical protein